MPGHSQREQVSPPLLDFLHNSTQCIGRQQSQLNFKLNFNASHEPPVYNETAAIWVFLEMRILTKLGTDIVEAERMKPSD